MRCTNLSDQFSITGKALQQFLDLVQDLSRNTFIREMATERMELLPVMDTNVLKNSFIPSLSFSGKIRPSPGMIDNDVICIGKIQNTLSEEPITLRAISLKQILEKGGSKELFLESKEQSRLFIRYDKKLYFTSPRLAESLCARVKLYGDAIYDTSVERAAFIMRLLKNSPQTFRASV